MNLDIDTIIRELTTDSFWVKSLTRRVNYLYENNTLFKEKLDSEKGEQWLRDFIAAWYYDGKRFMIKWESQVFKDKKVLTTKPQRWQVIGDSGVIFQGSKSKAQKILDLRGKSFRLEIV